MKLSLAWLFDHIDADWRKIDVAALVHRFNKTTAEIDGFDKISLKLNDLGAGTVTVATEQLISVDVPEWGKTYDLPAREGVNVGQVYIIVRTGSEYNWATIAHLGGQKDGLLPAVTIAQKEMNGAWKKQIEEHDIILHLDNKSVNHRPDMWGHRGVAREIAAILDLPFKALGAMLLPHESIEYEKKSPSTKEHTFSVTIENSDSCKKFAGLYFEHIEAPASLVWMAARLAKVDSRPINAIVDATNYVMLDIGQPMHAFDAHKLSAQAIVVRNAKNKETMALLDGQTVELSSDDCVVTDGKKPIALAGIMGGKESAVTASTKAIFLEAACFDATVIRKTAMRVKKRTESSARFEKSLDPAQLTIAIERFLKIIDQAGITFKAPDAMVVVGPPHVSKEVTLSHTYIEQLLGVALDQKFVSAILEKLGFGVDNKNGVYHITIPSFRATKDIAIKQDIVEEIGRFYGYDVIAEVLPSRQTKPFDLQAVMRMRRIKQLLAYSFKMQELYTYAFFDEAFLQSITWEPGSTLRVQEAVSENWQRLVTNLVPNLLKAVQVHANEYDTINFFEWAKIWPQDEAEVKEQSSLAGILVNQKHAIDFYQIKLALGTLAQLLGMQFEWIKADDNALSPWYLPHQTAKIFCDGVCIGTAGKANPAFFGKIATGDAFIFELDGTFLLAHKLPLKRYTLVSKYPGIVRDVSALVPVVLTVAQLRDALVKLDAKIVHVGLADFFQKPEWPDQKSLTFRISMLDPEATMTTQQADAIMHKVNDYLQKQGAVIR